ncbi:MAG: molecular chaperone HscB [Planctomycetota bacterium]|jgi:molecular chaperone HscB
MKLCPACELPLTTPLVCTNCNAFQTVDAAQNPFNVLGLEPSWAVDPKQLKRNLLRFSRFVHPDFFASEEEEVRENAERASAALNSAYEILHNDLARADWLVNSLGGPMESEDREMPQAFLMQVMEWSEILEDAKSATPDSPEWKATQPLADELHSERAKRLQAIGTLLAPLPEEASDTLATARREINAIRYIDRARKELKSLQLTAALGGPN